MKLFTFALFVGCALSTPVAVNSAQGATSPQLHSRQAASCDAVKVAQLSGGIQANLDVQKEELAG